mmetsp:Transcript_113636/g.275979  ORF Transcript_113636/g.275979 Transcript_113636/m.275979 type:complete len:202 (-) Transcript_113636:70-675(-)
MRARDARPRSPPPCAESLTRVLSRRTPSRRTATDGSRCARACRRTTHAAAQLRPARQRPTWTATSGCRRARRRRCPCRTPRRCWSSLTLSATPRTSSSGARPQGGPPILAPSKRHVRSTPTSWRATGSRPASAPRPAAARRSRRTPASCSTTKVCSYSAMRTYVAPHPRARSIRLQGPVNHHDDLRLRAALARYRHEVQRR